jgi:hypothetical protein
MARKHFAFDSNKLNDLGQYLGVGKKIPTTGFDLWKRCMAGEDAAWEKMERYNRRDIVLLEKVYLKLRPYATTHPKLDVYQENGCCPRCQSLRVIRKGIAITINRKYQQWKCQDCGSWFHGANIPRLKKWPT